MYIHCFIHSLSQLLSGNVPSIKWIYRSSILRKSSRCKFAILNIKSSGGKFITLDTLAVEAKRRFVKPLSTEAITTTIFSLKYSLNLLLLQRHWCSLLVLRLHFSDILMLQWYNSVTDPKAEGWYHYNTLPRLFSYSTHIFQGVYCPFWNNERTLDFSE